MKRLNKPNGNKQHEITPAIKEKIQKAAREVKWHFGNRTQADMVALAMLGQSNAVIRQDCKLSDHEITYGLMKSQKLQGLKGGYRRAWSNGESDICRQVKADLMGVLRQEVQRNLPPLAKAPPKQEPTQ